MSSTPVPFYLLVLGPFAQSDVVCTIAPDRMTLNGSTEALIEAAWNDRLALAQARGQSLFPGPMCRFQGWEVMDGQLHISFGMTDYREFVGTNIVNPVIQSQFGEEYLANGTGVCSVLVTSDDMLIIQRRSQTVFEHPGLLNFCGGSLNPVKSANGESRADPFVVMSTEFEEEMGMGKESILEMTCLGLSRDSMTLKPDILLRTRVSLPSAAIMQATGDEQSELIAIPNDPAALHAWIGTHWNEIAPSGLASLVAHLACTFAQGFASTWSGA